MKIELIQVGKTEKGFINDGVLIYEQRLKHYISYNVITIENLKTNKNKTIAEIKESERIEIEKKISPQSFVVLLDEKGKHLTSSEYAGFLQKKMNESTKNLVFIIGGAYGFHENLYAKADLKLSLSSMTFSHQLIRILFTEQLYRAFTIIKGEPYHNE